MNTPLSVNDVHSGLNPTRLRRLVTPQTIAELSEAMACAAREKLPVAVCGCRHAMGGQQFATDGCLIDTRSLRRVLSFDREAGLIRAEAGIQWPELIAYCLEAQAEAEHPWGIAQKQTGADTFTLGGSLSANAHGRGLARAPIIQDVEAFTLVKADGSVVHCSRTEQADLFSLVIGGYGLFGIIAEVTLRLVPRCRVERIVEIVSSEEVMEKFQQRIDEGFLYGDFQFSIDEASEDFLQKGVFSCYRPTDRPAPASPPRELEESNWMELLCLAYSDRAAAYRNYAAYYLSTNGQVYWSDTHQLSAYLPDYAQRIQQFSGAAVSSSLLITELYVPRTELAAFLGEAARELQERGVLVIYGTVRLIERDTESFLAWAREPYACIIFNLLVEHTPAGREKAAGAFRALIDLATARGGSYYLTYHRFASLAQVERCYPQFGRFLAAKLEHDPHELLQSDWYRHYRDLWAQHLL